MNKKEIAEIKKQLTPDRCTITRISGCYVDADKTIKTRLNQAFLSLSEEEMYKYFDLIRKSLSGSIGRNLLVMDFPTEAEQEGGTQEFLLELKRSRLEDEELLDEFYTRMIENYDYAENYYIILAHAVYDIPGKSTDGLEMFDASDEIYEHLFCSICPVNLTKAGLCYNAETNNIEDRIRDWLVEMPDVGFLFPLFRDRSTDIHGILYYTRRPEKMHADFAEQLLGCRMPLSPVSQKESFQTLVEETLAETCSFDTAVTLHGKLNDLITDSKDEPDPVVLTKSEVRRLLEDSGAENEHMESFDERYDSITGEDTSLVAANITNTRKLEVKTAEISVTVPPEQAPLLETRVIDGRKYLLVPLDQEVEVNGIHVYVE